MFDSQAASNASERRERATRTERAGVAASERACRGPRGNAPRMKLEMRAAPRAIARLVCAVAAFVQIAVSQTPPEARRMSFHNRLLLNRAAIGGLRSLEVLLLVGHAESGGPGRGSMEDVRALVARLRGHVSREEDAIGYLRIEVPTERLLELAASPAIDAYQISSLSKGAWYRDTPPMSNADMYRNYEVTPIAATEPTARHMDLPLVSTAEAREAGFTADDAGVGEWLREHPTFDGRGVTIALLENALPSFTDATLRSAKTLDGREIPKLAGILSILDAADLDETRVPLNAIVDAPKSWARVGNRTYVLPRPGHYQLGVLELPAGANVVHRFAVIEDQSTRDVWIDANGDASFQDETPLADVNERFEPRVLKLSYPRKADVSFVMAHGRQPHVIHIYAGKGSHQTMTLSVAAGSRTDEGLAYGVAPNARVLLVRISSSETSLARAFEGFIEAAQRPDVDVISTSTGLTAVPDTAADFAGALFSRLIATYHKPIVDAAGNTSLMLGSVHAGGDTLSVGGTLSPATWAALYGGRALDRLIVHPTSAAGPSLDGAIKPDFLAPMERLAADLPWNADIDAAPRNAPTRRIPPGYQVSCCTSATSPYAAGVVALLISAARQSRISYTADSLRRAMTVSAHQVPGFQPHQQGNGALDINLAWLELTHSIDPPRIVASAAIVHPLAQYAARGPSGEGILEFEGWRSGMTGTREIVLRRESGPARPVTYSLDWTGNDGTFGTASSVTLPLGQAVPVRVQIDVASPGAHSSILNLRDAATNAVMFRTQATIVAAESFDASTRCLRVTGRIPLMRQGAHYFHIPAGAGAIAFDLEVTKGVIRPTIVASHGLFTGYYMHVHPNNVEFMGKGRYQIVLPNPEPGTWTFRVDADSASFIIPGNPVPGDDGDAEYTVTMRLLDGSIRTSTATSGHIVADIMNAGAAIAEPVLEATPGYLTSHRGSFLPTGLPNVIEMAMPPNAATLSLHLRSERERTNTELYLYDCTTGECFSYNIGFPAAGAHTLVVRKPNAGRWVAAVNAAPFPTTTGGFVLDEIVTAGTPTLRASAATLGPGARWQEIIGDLQPLPATAGKTAIVFFELGDAALERAEDEHPWAATPRFKLRDRPVAIGTAIHR
jgi:Subtilase family